MQQSNAKVGVIQRSTKLDKTHALQSNALFTEKKTMLTCVHCAFGLALKMTALSNEASLQCGQIAAIYTEHSVAFLNLCP